MIQFSAGTPGFLRSIALLAGIAAIGAIPGCGKDEGKVKSKATVSASGKAEYDGKPIPAGTVTFLNKTTGNSASCPISNGTYSCDKESGPNPGDNAVTIIGMEGEGGAKLWPGAWSTQVQVGESEYKGDFAVDTKKIKKPAKGKKPVSEMEDT